MDFDDLKNKLDDLVQSLNNWILNTVNSTKSYFESLDQLEMFGWGGNALGLILVIVAFIVF